MKKVLLIILCLIFLSGCSANYEITFNKNDISENIDITIDRNIYEIDFNNIGDGEYIEEEITKEYIPLLNIDNRYYKKIISVKNGNTYVNLTGNYLYDELEKSYIINHCFNNVYISNTDKYLDISLKDLTCHYGNTLNLKISSFYNIISSNSDYNKDGIYNWSLETIDKNGIELRIIKEVSSNNKGGFIKTLSIILIVLFIISGSAIFILKKNND